MQSGSNERVTKLREYGAGTTGEVPMLVILILAMLAIVATVIAMIMASPLYRTLTMAFDCWAESTPTAERRASY